MIVYVSRYILSIISFTAIFLGIDQRLLPSLGFNLAFNLSLFALEYSKIVLSNF